MTDNHDATPPLASDRAHDAQPDPRSESQRPGLTSSAPVADHVRSATLPAPTVPGAYPANDGHLVDELPSAPLVTTDHTASHQPAPGATLPDTTLPGPKPASTAQATGRKRFWSGVAVGSLAMGTFALGGFAGVALSAQDDPTSPPIQATPVAAGSTGAVPGSVHELVTAVRPSIVAIHTTISGTDPFGQQSIDQAAGTGWVLSADGYIVTNSHVVEGASAIEVSFSDGSTVDANLVGADARADLAVLEVDRTDLSPLAIGDSSLVNVGDGVIAIGNALDLGAEPTVTGGLVSAKDRTISEPNGAVLVNLIQTDAAISRGNSGGPLLNGAGEVIGINTLVSGLGENIGFAIDINSAMDFIDELRAGRTPSHPLLGVSSTLPTDGSSGAQVTDVSANSAAADAGIQRDDVIVSIDGEPIAKPEDLAGEVARHRPGDPVKVELVRNGESITVTATLGARDAASS